jgi:hypothetical protein
MSELFVLLSKKSGLACSVAVALAGCVPSEFYVQQGVTFDRYERDGVGCATVATQAVPTNTQVGWAPYVGIYSVDTNSPLRDKNMEICMRDRGYQRIEIPYCSGEALTAATAAAKQPQDRNRKMSITPQSCYALAPDGTQFLYSPGSAE